MLIGCTLLCVVDAGKDKSKHHSYPAIVIDGYGGDSGWTSSYMAFNSKEPGYAKIGLTLDGQRVVGDFKCQIQGFPKLKGHKEIEEEGPKFYEDVDNGKSKTMTKMPYLPEDSNFRVHFKRRALVFNSIELPAGSDRDALLKPDEDLGQLFTTVELDLSGRVSKESHELDKKRLTIHRLDDAEEFVTAASQYVVTDKSLLSCTQKIWVDIPVEDTDKVGDLKVAGGGWYRANVKHTKKGYRVTFPGQKGPKWMLDEIDPQCRTMIYNGYYWYFHFHRDIKKPFKGSKAKLACKAEDEEAPVDEDEPEEEVEEEEDDDDDLERTGPGLEHELGELNALIEA